MWRVKALYQTSLTGLLIPRLMLKLVTLVSVAVANTDPGPGPRLTNETAVSPRSDQSQPSITVSKCCGLDQVFIQTNMSCGYPGLEEVQYRSKYVWNIYFMFEIFNFNEFGAFHQHEWIERIQPTFKSLLFCQRVGWCVSIDVVMGSLIKGFGSCSYGSWPGQYFLMNHYFQLSVTRRLFSRDGFCESSISKHQHSE